MKYTEDQQNVIDSRGQSLLVTAAAGSGKTAVLVRRIIDRVIDKEHPVDIDHILCLTFTEAAASEMKSRLLSFINEALSENPDDTRLMHQSVLVHRAFVMTIDAFCNYVVSNHFQEIDLEPGMKIIDAGQEKVLRQQIIDDYFEELYLLEEDDKRRKDFITAVEFLSDKGDDSKLKEMIFNVHEAASSYPYPDEWLSNAQEQYRLAADGSSDWIAEFADYIEAVLEDACGALCQCADECSNIGHEKGEELLADDIAAIEKTVAMYQNADTALDRLKVLNDYFKNDLSNTFASWRAYRADKSLSDSIRNNRNKIRDKLKKINDNYFYFPIEKSLEDIESLTPFIETIIALTREYGSRLLEKKRQDMLMSFADCEHYALDILTEKTDSGHAPTATALELSEYFEEIMCDEYQDSNAIQEAILSSISREYKGENNRFMVGDVKQSIYRFRKANPELIKAKMAEYKDSGAKRRIDLKSNFRSRKEVIDTINGVFKRLMHSDFGGIDYDERAKLSYGALDYDKSAPLNKTKLHMLNLDSSDDIKEEEAEAMLIASIVKENVGNTTVFDKVTDKGKYSPRKADYGDIAIILRTARLAPTLTEIFRREGIPIYVASKKGYYDSAEIVTMLAFLRTIENPRQDIYLYSVLTSPIAGFSDADMAVVKARTADDATCLYDRIVCYKDEDDDIAARLSRFLDMLSYYRSLSTYESVSSLIERILDETGFLYYVLSMPDGEQRGRNLRLLSNIASELGKDGGSLLRFITYIEETVEKQDSDTGAATSGEDSSNAVRVYTIHGSKGLEFPICIIGDLAHGFNLMDTKNRIVLDNKYGIVCQYFDPVRRIKKDTIIRKFFAAKEQDEIRAEELRLLYVAMTRAREKLIFTAAVSQQKKDTNNGVTTVAQKFAEAEHRIANTKDGGHCPTIWLRGAGSLLDYVLLGLAGEDEVLQEWSLDDVIGKNISREIEIRDRKSILPKLSASNPEREKICNELAARFLAEYSHPELDGLYTKTSVSELKKSAYEKAIDETAEEAYAAIPSYTEGGGTDFGTAHHRVMELFDFAGDCTDEDIKEQIKGMSADGFMPEDYASYVNPKRIRTFLESSCGLRMRKAALCGTLRREQPFFLGIPASQMKEGLSPDETVLVQGIVDALWEEDGQMVILDYKTDRIKQIDELEKRYETQLYYYKRAIEAACGMTVKECILYSFCLGDEISLASPSVKV